MTKRTKIAIWIIIIIVAALVCFFIVYYPRNQTKITYKECIEQGGEIAERDSDTIPSLACDSGQQFLGDVVDVRCLCVCCK